MPSLQIHRFWIRDLAIHHAQDFEPLPSRNLNVQVSISARLVSSEDPPYRMMLKVETSPAENMADLQYRLDGLIIGDFAIQPVEEAASAAALHLLAFNGLAMLYGFARDTVLHLTALGTNGAFILPPANLTQAATELEANWHLSTGEDAAELLKLGFVLQEPMNAAEASPPPRRRPRTAKKP